MPERVQLSLSTTVDLDGERDSDLEIDDLDALGLRLDFLTEGGLERGITGSRLTCKENTLSSFITTSLEDVESLVCLNSNQLPTLSNLEF